MKRILVVEDNELRRSLLEEEFKRLGFIVVAVESGAEALEALKAVSDTEFQLIISDVNLPGIDGFELAKIVKKDQRRQHIHVLLYSSQTPVEEEVIELAKRSRVDRYILQSGVPGIVNDVLDYLR